MEAYITPQRIANSILLDRSFEGYYLLVEGKKDIKVYRKFIDENQGKLKPTFGKYNLRKVYSILSSAGFEKKIGIRDADFLRIKGNGKFDISYSDYIFPTDHHDSEVMIIGSNALDNLLNNVSTEEKIKQFEIKHNRSIRDLAYSLAYPMGCLKLANKKYNLGLSFKPERPESNKIKFKKIICDSRFISFGDATMINIVHEYSKNRGNILSCKETILEKLHDVMNTQHDITEIVNGHDLAEILFLIIKKGLGSSSRLLQDAECIEDALAMSFDITHFSQTHLFNTIKSWEKSNNSILI